jgi:predicted XRE-type DNA-binding protein
MKAITFLGNSLECLREFPEDARQDAGYALDQVQRGKQPSDFKPMASVGKGVEELRVWDLPHDLPGPIEGGGVRAARLPEEDSGHEQARHRDREESIRRTDARTQMKKRDKTYASVWDALADTPEQAANLQARADLMRQIAELIQAEGWKQVEAAERCGVTQPRINDLLRGRVSRFSLDALVNIATALGRGARGGLRARQRRSGRPLARNLTSPRCRCDLGSRAGNGAVCSGSRPLRNVRVTADEGQQFERNLPLA